VLNFDLYFLKIYSLPLQRNIVYITVCQELYAVYEFHFDVLLNVLDAPVGAQLIDEFVEQFLFRLQLQLLHTFVLGKELVDLFVLTQILTVENYIENVQIVRGEHLGTNCFLLVEHSEENSDEGHQVD